MDDSMPNGYTTDELNDSAKYICNKDVPSQEEDSLVKPHE